MSKYSPARAFGSSVRICVSAPRKLSRVSLRSQQEMKSMGRARKTSKENATLATYPESYRESDPDTSLVNVKIHFCLALIPAPSPPNALKQVYL